MTLTLALAQRVLAAGIGAAEQRGETVTVAVVDSAGTLVALARCDGAAVPTVDVAVGKAFTAGTLATTTDVLQPLTQPGGPLFGLIEAVSYPRSLVVLPGGAPIRVDGRVVGGVGVAGGGTPATDQEIASLAAGSGVAPPPVASAANS